MAISKHDDPNYIAFRRRLLNIVTVAVLIFFSIIGCLLLQHPDFKNIVLFCILTYVALRILYELTLNRARVPTLATGFFERRKIAAIIKGDAEGRNDYAVVDFGSGRGELTRAIAHKVPRAKVIGLEIGAIAHWQAEFLRKLFGFKNIRYLRQDFFTFDCSGADAVVMYLNRSLAIALGEKFRQELKPGALIISNEFELHGTWQPVESIKLYTPFEVTLWVYRK